MSAISPFTLPGFAPSACRSICWKVAPGENMVSRVSLVIMEEVFPNKNNELSLGKRLKSFKWDSFSSEDQNNFSVNFIGIFRETIQSLKKFGDARAIVECKVSFEVIITSAPNPKIPLRCREYEVSILQTLNHSLSDGEWWEKKLFHPL